MALRCEVCNSETAAHYIMVGNGNVCMTCSANITALVLHHREHFRDLIALAATRTSRFTAEEKIVSTGNLPDDS